MKEIQSWKHRRWEGASVRWWAGLEPPPASAATVGKVHEVRFETKALLASGSSSHVVGKSRLITDAETSAADVPSA